ncbi:hypothetical protein P152DRAFT_452782 [Eremomyces bilateralis CBS 781.70]|uniref:Uncharacterized protein n=1 Tax=Eremomyces bilateralis CBS 781.70 TaxID=1392243 RepID=A0A6G1FS70_9PEZI|nr:uncharacterized protein P152DRAFT_452782 [Eremomyces bilateralis CBS 781.70]KAF1808568.1 hypothetical protein P152DRAFT_452782 [Eremomyces bilateralis CBS 781.70]
MKTSMILGVALLLLPASFALPEPQGNRGGGNNNGGGRPGGGNNNGGGRPGGGNNNGGGRPGGGNNNGGGRPGGGNNNGGNWGGNNGGGNWNPGRPGENNGGNWNGGNNNGNEIWGEIIGGIAGGIAEGWSENWSGRQGGWSPQGLGGWRPVTATKTVTRTANPWRPDPTAAPTVYQYCDRDSASCAEGEYCVANPRSNCGAECDQSNICVEPENTCGGAEGVECANQICVDDDAYCFVGADGGECLGVCV